MMAARNRSMRLTTRSASPTRVRPARTTRSTLSASGRSPMASFIINIGGVSRSTMSNSVRQRLMIVMSSGRTSGVSSLTGGGTNHTLCRRVMAGSVTPSNERAGSR